MPTKKRAGTKRSPIPNPKRELGERITVENVNVPGYTTRLDATMYRAMQAALLKVLPPKGPGLTQDEMRRAVVPHLPESLFPGGAKAGWWAKSVQLDLEAKGVIAREATKPLRWHRKPVR
jgi:hypothetical protein